MLRGTQRKLDYAQIIEVNKNNVSLKHIMKKLEELHNF